MPDRCTAPRFEIHPCRLNQWIALPSYSVGPHRLCGVLDSYSLALKSDENIHYCTGTVQSTSEDKVHI